MSRSMRRGAGAWSGRTALGVGLALACGDIAAIAPPAQAQVVAVDYYRPYYPPPYPPRYYVPPAA
ncbi:MAG: hypothetical protein JO021_23905, partial [Alphaproteobacteria bacterium]|nr:hypothetical protein [Alphaproteobacteria bacterium]